MLIDDNLVGNQKRKETFEESRKKDDGIVRTAKVKLANPNVNKQGWTITSSTLLERQVQKNSTCLKVQYKVTLIIKI